MAFRSQASVCAHMKTHTLQSWMSLLVQKHLLSLDKYTKTFILWEHLLIFPMKTPCALASVQTYFPSLHLLRSQISALLAKYLLRNKFQFTFYTIAIFNSGSTESNTKPASIRVTPVVIFSLIFIILFELGLKTFGEKIICFCKYNP